MNREIAAGPHAKNEPPTRPSDVVRDLVDILNAGATWAGIAEVFDTARRLAQRR